MEKNKRPSEDGQTGLTGRRKRMSSSSSKTRPNSETGLTGRGICKYTECERVERLQVREQWKGLSGGTDEVEFIGGRGRGMRGRIIVQCKEA